jgi:hypothetical protein
MALCLKHKARHEYAQRFLAPIQDWVQLPTKVEMDEWRKKNEYPIVYRVVTKVIVTPTKRVAEQSATSGQYPQLK